MKVQCQVCISRRRKRKQRSIFAFQDIILYSHALLLKVYNTFLSFKNYFWAVKKRREWRAHAAIDNRRWRERGFGEFGGGGIGVRRREKLMQRRGLEWSLEIWRRKRCRLGVWSSSGRKWRRKKKSAVGQVLYWSPLLCFLSELVSV